MSHEIETDYQEDYHNEDKWCTKCDSHESGYCKELEQEVSPTGTCDFFKSID